MRWENGMEILWCGIWGGKGSGLLEKYSMSYVASTIRL